MDAHKKSVVITGASTGIGKICALALARQGWNVFAGVRKAGDMEMLRHEGQGRVTPILIDVTRPEVIASATRQVNDETGGIGLDGLVNNAGIAVGGPLEFVPVTQLRQQLEVNVVGQLAVTQSFLPQLRRVQGRLVLIGSVSGLCSLPLFGPYCASKFALEALGDSLRLELRPWGMHVSLVDPGATRTTIWEKSLSENHAMVANFPPEAGFLYGGMLARLDQVIQNTCERAIPATRVAEAVIHALTARKPKPRYIVGEMARVQLVMEALPVGLRDFILAQLFLSQPGPARSAPV